MHRTHVAVVNRIVVIKVTETNHTPKGNQYITEHRFEFTPHEAEALLYDLHSVVTTLRGHRKRRPFRVWLGL